MEFTIGTAVIELNNREIAVTFWLGVLLLAGVVVVWRGDGSSALLRFLRLLVHPLLLALVLFLVAWSSALVWLGTSLGLWRWELLKETVVWFVGSALVLLFNIDKLEGDPGYLRNRARALIAWTVLVTFVANLSSLSLVAELMLQPFLVLLVVMSVAGERSPEHRATAKLGAVLLTVIGLGLIVHSIADLARHWGEIDGRVLGLAFALPAWMTLGLMPAVYGLAIAFAYDGARRRIRLDSSGGWATARSLLALVVERVFRPDEVARIRLYWARQLAIAASFDEARQVVVRLRSDLAQRQQVEAARQERLRTFAGVDGTNEFGVPLDQREFEETVSALFSLGSSHGGWYRRGNRYREEPFTFFLERLAKEGLSGGEDVRYAVATNRRSWWASRRTVSGWVLGIGASGPPPDEWVYEGAEHPTGFPEQSAGWHRSWEAQGGHW